MPKLLKDPGISKPLRDSYTKALVGLVKRTGRYYMQIVRENLRGGLGLLINIPQFSIDSETFQTEADFRNAFRDTALNLVRMHVHGAIARGRSYAEFKLQKMGIVQPVPTAIIPTMAAFPEIAQYYININLSHLNGLNQKMRDQLRLFISVAATSNLSNKEIYSQVREIINKTAKQAERIARTEIIRMMNIATMRRFLENGIQQWRWNSALERGTQGMQKEGRTCHYCYSLHGQIRNIGDPFGPGPNRKPEPTIMPPAHPNCRCAMEPVVQMAAFPVKKKKKQRWSKITVIRRG